MAASDQMANKRPTKEEKASIGAHLLSATASLEDFIELSGMTWDGEASDRAWGLYVRLSKWLTETYLQDCIAQ